MKLFIGENIRIFLKKNDLTQEELANRLGVTYQSVSRWENGTTYPDLELLPAISEVLEVTVDELLGMPQVEKEKRAVEAFDELRRECMKVDYDADVIVTLLRDIRRNYLGSDSSWRPWVEGNDRAFSDPKILPEVRMMAEAYLKRHQMAPHVLQTMAWIESEENLKDFLGKHTTSFDCSERALLFERYFRSGDIEKFEPERKYQLKHAFDILLCPSYLVKPGEDEFEADIFMEAVLSLIRRDADDDRPDIWTADRIELGLKSAMSYIIAGEKESALNKLKAVVKLLEETMKITDEIPLPTSCRFLEGMECHAHEMWDDRYNDPDAQKERLIYMDTRIGSICSCSCIYPSRYLDTLQGKGFEPISDDPEFKKLCERVKALIVIKA